jgi:hypothetical protein
MTTSYTSNNPGSSLTLGYPWYASGEWPMVEQGDLLPNCPVLTPPNEFPEELPTAKEGDSLTIPSRIVFADLIVLTQSCDLVNDKIDQVLLCAHFPADEYSKGERSSIRKEQRPAVHMIEQCDIQGQEFSQRVIDFRTIYTLPKDFVFSFASKLGGRVRLLPPYREHLAQAFARYFMRVGLPRPLKEK